MQAALIDTEDRLDKAEKGLKAERRGIRAVLFDSEQRVQKLTEQFSVSRRREIRWRRKYLEVVGDEFVDCPASA